jgi:hypothetical protein
MAVKSALYADRALPPGRSLVLISGRGWANSRALVRLEGIGNPSDLIGNSTRCLPACITMPRWTTTACPSIIPWANWNLCAVCRRLFVFGSEINCRRFSTSALYGGQWSASLSECLESKTAHSHSGRGNEDTSPHPFWVPKPNRPAHS